MREPALGVVVGALVVVAAVLAPPVPVVVLGGLVLIPVGAVVAEPPVAVAEKSTQSVEAAPCALRRSPAFVQAVSKQGPARGSRAACLAGSHWQAVSVSAQPTLGMLSVRHGIYRKSKAH
jgi:hypothetical protein